jgi:hypothetical protein
LFWKPCAIAGICLIAIGIGAGYFDEATNFGFEFISDHFGIFLDCASIGIVLAFIGLIGWVRHLKSGTRKQMAGAVFAAPWFGCALGYALEGLNIHGGLACSWFSQFQPRFSLWFCSSCQPTNSSRSPLILEVCI